MAEEESNSELEEFHTIVNRAGDSLPKPAGWRMLIAVPKAREQTEGGIFKPGQAIRDEELGTIIGLVIQVGPLAFKDSKKFGSNGPWAHRGDYIMMRSYTGTRFMVGDQEFRLINDESVEAIVDNPGGITKVL